MSFYDPFEQFEIYNFNVFFYKLNNLIFYYYLISIIFFILFILNLKNASILPNSPQLILEGIYKFILSLFDQHVGLKHSLIFFPLLNSLFTFILISNFTGLLPFGFTITGHLLVTFVLSFSIFNSITITAIRNHGLNFFTLFVPKNDVPLPLLIFLVIIEIVSYCIRPFSLSIRLFANMLAGHTLLNIISSFVFYLFNNIIILAILINLFIFAIILLELAIAFIQSYVFVVLICIYINDAYNISH